MKKTGLLICLVAGLIACQSQDKKIPAGALTQEQKDKAAADSANFTTIQWIDSSYHDFGKVKEGEVVEVNYRFKNSGNKPLVIQDVKPGCGCTIAEKLDKPFAPGEEGVVRAKFNSNGHPGTNEKYITVLANTNPDKTWILHFKVEVTK